MDTRRQEEQERLHEITALERPLWQAGILPAGVDEVGRGPLAGPVMAACVVLAPQPLIEGVNDSKKLSEKRRAQISRVILDQAFSVGFGRVGPKRIDEIGIKEATLEAMRRCVIEAGATYLLVDGEHVPIALPQQRIVHGDALSYLIGAASIVAKVKRDAVMAELDTLYPEYGFARHKGYGTKEHIAAIRRYGLCPAHRESFTRSFI